jgi:hypothetical protein
MASITRTDFLNLASDLRLETAITTVMSDYRSGWVSGSADVTDANAQLQLRNEVIKFLTKRLARMARRREYGYTA